MRLLILMLLLWAAPACAQTDWAARLTEGDVTLRRFPFPLGRDAAGAAHPLCHARHAAPRRARARSTMR